MLSRAKKRVILKFKCCDKVWIFGDFLEWGEKEAKIKIWIEKSAANNNGGLTSIATK